MSCGRIRPARMKGASVATTGTGGRKDAVSGPDHRNETSYGPPALIAPGFGQYGQPQIRADDDVDEVSSPFPEKTDLSFRVETAAGCVEHNADPGGTLGADRELGDLMGRKAVYAL